MFVNVNGITRNFGYFGHPHFPLIILNSSNNKIDAAEFKKKVVRFIKPFIEHKVQLNKNQATPKSPADLKTEIQNDLKQMMTDIVKEIQENGGKISYNPTSSKYVKGGGLVNELNSEINSILNNSL